MNNELQPLHNILIQKFSNYETMLAVGSIATGDKWVDGRSDNDIVLIFDGLYSQHFDTLETIFKGFNFDDSYLFVPLSKEEIQSPKNKTHMFSHRFRSNVLYGKGLEFPHLPNKKEGYNMYFNGLNSVYWRMSKRIPNSIFWSDDKTRKEFWKFFKHSFMYLAIKSYYQDSYYPNTRKRITEHYKSETLKKTLKTLENINTTSKEQIIETAKELKEYLLKQIDNITPIK